MILTPQTIEKAATDIVEFWDSSELPETDKKKILEMVQSFYDDKNEHIYEQYFAQLLKRTVDKHCPQTGFEK